LISKKSSPLKPLRQMNRNLVGSILGMSSINNAHLFPIHRGEDFFKSANQKQELPMAAMFVNGSGQNEQSLERTFRRCFLPSFDFIFQSIEYLDVSFNKISTLDGFKVMS
jgi:hypothetical protein